VLGAGVVSITGGCEKSIMTAGGRMGVVMTILYNRIVGLTVVTMFISMIVGLHHAMIVRMILGTYDRRTDGGQSEGGYRKKSRLEQLLTHMRFLV
jgi:hypothetical protein